jgi:hypothetical protein
MLTYFEDTITITKSGQLSLSPQKAATENGNVYVGWIDNNNVHGDTRIAFGAGSSGREIHN